MKRIITAILSAICIIGLVSCSAEKSYSYKDFKALVASKTFTFDYTKAHAEITTNGEKSTREYTYDKDQDCWYYPGTVDVFGIELETELVDHLDINSAIESLDNMIAAYEKTEADLEELVNFYASDTSYHIILEHEDDDYKTKAEQKFNGEGLIVYTYNFDLDKESGEKDIIAVSITYSK